VIRVLGFALYGELAASTRHRLSQFRPRLIDHGIDLTVTHLLGDDYLRSRFGGTSVPWASILRSAVHRIDVLLRDHSYDRAIVHCETLPFVPELIERAMLRVPYMYDFDDAFFAKYRVGRFSALSPILGGKFDGVIERASCVSAGSRVLLSFASRLNRASHLMPTVVDVRRYPAKTSYRSDSFNIGWIGSPSTAKYLEILKAPLQAVAREFAVCLTVIGATAPRIEGVDVVSIPWSEATEASAIREFDVGVMPLLDDEWSRGKCAFKLIQYMACGVPVVASPVGANTDVVTADCGFLASSTDEWSEAFRRLRDDSAMRERLGSEGRRRVVSHYSLDVAAPKMADLIVGLA